MRKQILSLAIALPMAITGAASSNASEGVKISEAIQSGQSAPAVKVEVINGQEKPSFPNHGQEVDRRRPRGPGGIPKPSELNNVQGQSHFKLSPETRARPRPKGPGGTEVLKVPVIEQLKK
jgi:hypothetical protein